MIVQLGNDILKNLGVEEPIDDVAVFFSDEFYIQFFQAAFPEIDFSQLTAGQDVAEMAENIQALIDLLGEQILKYDLSHIMGVEIVNGNPEHCINLLQLVQEISVMIQSKTGGVPGMQQHEEHEEEDGGPASGPATSQKKQRPPPIGGMMAMDDEGEDSQDEDGHFLGQGDD